jgi:hypothetical protein
MPVDFKGWKVLDLFDKPANIAASSGATPEGKAFKN